MDMAPIGAITMTSRELSQDAGRAKKRALKGPVFITDRGRPAHVLLSIEEYWRLTGERGGRSLAEALEQTDPDADFDFEIEEFKDRVFARPAEFDPE